MIPDADVGVAPLRSSAYDDSAIQGGRAKAAGCTVLFVVGLSLGVIWGLLVTSH